MADVIPTSSNEHVAVVKATAPKYFKEASDLTFRRRLWLAMLEKYGQIEYNASSFACVWDVEYSQPEVRQYGDQGDQEFNEHDALLQLTCDVRGYTTTDRLTKKKQLMNQGATQIYDLYKKKSENLLKAIRDKFCGELYIDGNLAANANRLLGIESFMGDDGATVAADIVANPSDTYAGQSTALGANGGNWTTDLTTYPNATAATDWPWGNGDTEYDCLSPLLVNYSSTSWNTSSTDWIDNCEEVLRFAGIACASKNGDDNIPMLHMLDAKLYGDFLNFHAARNRIVLPHKESQDLGFSKTMNFEGAAVHFEFDCPANVGYGITPNNIELFSMENQLFIPDGPEWSIERKGWLYEVGFFGNMRFQPKFFARYAAYA
jgi:hypothetical protein